jgi:hypothetical protein
MLAGEALALDAPPPEVVRRTAAEEAQAAMKSVRLVAMGISAGEVSAGVAVAPARFGRWRSHGFFG